MTKPYEITIKIMVKPKNQRDVTLPQVDEVLEAMVVQLEDLNAATDTDWEVKMSNRILRKYAGE